MKINCNHMSWFTESPSPSEYSFPDGSQVFIVAGRKETKNEENQYSFNPSTNNISGDRLSYVRRFGEKSFALR